MTAIELDVQGMSCGGCENAVRTAVGALAGVSEVEADHASGTVRVRGDGFEETAVKAAIVEAGFTVG